MNQNTSTWRIVQLRDESPTVKTLFLEALGEQPPCIPGQYLTVTLPDIEPKEGKGYSISSIPEDKFVTLTIKRMGAFSNTILALKVGDTLTTSLPYGYFYQNQTRKEHAVAFFAGGIGIAPIASMIRSELSKECTRSLFLFYSSQTESEFVFKNTFDRLAKEHALFVPIYFITRAPAPSSDFCEGRISAEDVLDTIMDPTNTDFFVCGSLEFTKGITKMLRTTGAPSSQMYTEGFF